MFPLGYRDMVTLGWVTPGYRACMVYLVGLPQGTPLWLHGCRVRRYGCIRLVCPRVQEHDYIRLGYTRVQDCDCIRLGYLRVQGYGCIRLGYPRVCVGKVFTPPPQDECTAATGYLIWAPPPPPRTGGKDSENPLFYARDQNAQL